MEVHALMGTGSIQMCINEEIRNHLGLKTNGKMPSQLADGQKVMPPIAVPFKIIYGDRYSLTSTFVLPEDREALLGAIPLEELDLMVNPSRNEIVAIHQSGRLAVVM